MGARIVLVASLLGAAIVAGGVAGFTARVHPAVEPSLAAGCAGCHMSDYRGAPHHVGERPTTCGVCHTQSSWHEAHIDHPFALTGAHAKGSCFACHRGEPAVFHGTPSDCYDCHAEQYQRAPRHVGHLPTTCHECHGFDAWKPAAYHEPPPADTTPEALPEPSATASTLPVAPKPKPKPVVVKPKPKPPPIDVITHPSRRE